MERSDSPTQLNMENFTIHTPPKIYAELEIMEANIRLMQISTPYRDINVKLKQWIQDIEEWIQDTRSSRS